MNTALKMILAGASTAILLLLMLWKGFDTAPIFESVWAEIAFASILFMATMLFTLGGIKGLYDECYGKRPQKILTMDCQSCKYKRDEPGTPYVSCRAIKEHPAFLKLSLEEKGALEVGVAATGRFPYLAKDNSPLIEIHKSKDCYWPTSYDPSDILECHFMKLRPDAVSWERIK